VLIAQGTEAGGHTGEISTMVLVPEVVDMVGPDVPVLAAGGVGTGRQMAAAFALGAQGVWTGSLWLTVAAAAIVAVQLPRCLDYARQFGDDSRDRLRLWRCGTSRRTP